MKQVSDLQLMIMWKLRGNLLLNQNKNDWRQTFFIPHFIYFFAVKSKYLEAFSNKKAKLNVALLNKTPYAKV